MKKKIFIFILFVFLIKEFLYFLPKPLLINKSNFSQAIYDRNNKLLRLTLSSDEKYRLWTPLENIPEKLINSTLLQEDQYYYYHLGINPFSLLRAIYKTYITKQRTEGGSTISMQVARQRFAINSRSISGKAKQIFYALALERFYSKKEILEAYLNIAPYGANIEGVSAASLIYFEKNIENISIPEALSLAVLPQSPSSRTPFSEKGRAELLKARNNLARNWASNKELKSLLEMPLNISTRAELPFLAPHFVDNIISSNSELKIKTTLDLEIQKLLEKISKAYVERNNYRGIQNAIAILLNHKTMEVTAYVGSADYFNSGIQGQVNGLLGKRSPGSTLKPIIYALALEQGVIHPESIIKDTPLRLTNYNPENFEKDFLGPISATDALVKSRNVPAIFLTNSLKSPSLYEFLKSSGVKNLKAESFYGLALALGGSELSMEELSSLYAMLANNGELKKIKKIIDEPSEEKKLLSAESTTLVLKMLKENPEAGEAFDNFNKNINNIPWKTGTSFGFRDAWSIGIIGDYVLGVWIGNFDGTANANFIGREAAGPLFFEMADALRAKNLGIEKQVEPNLNIKKIQVCAISGALPGPNCKHLKETYFIPGKSPIQTCQVHREVLIDNETGLRTCAGFDSNSRKEVYEFWQSDILRLFRKIGIKHKLPPPYMEQCIGGYKKGIAPSITSPQSNFNYVFRSDSENKIAFSAVTEADTKIIYWFVDDSYIGTANSAETIFWNSRPGEYVVRAVDNLGRANSTKIKVLVEKG